MDRVSRKVHPTAHVEVTSGTVIKFVTNYLDENGHITEIIGKISGNYSVQFLGFSDKSWGSRLPFTFNLLSHAEAKVW